MHQIKVLLIQRFEPSTQALCSTTMTKYTLQFNRFYNAYECQRKLNGKGVYLQFACDLKKEFKQVLLYTFYAL